MIRRRGPLDCKREKVVSGPGDSKLDVGTSILEALDGALLLGELRARRKPSSENVGLRSNG